MRGSVQNIQLLDEAVLINLTPGYVVTCSMYIAFDVTLDVGVEFTAKLICVFVFVLSTLLVFLCSGSFVFNIQLSYFLKFMHRLMKLFFFFFFLFSFTSLSSFFTHIETNQSVGGAKTGVPGEKPPDTPASRTWLVSHMNSCPVRGANTHR